jgi:hypothetical protein
MQVASPSRSVRLRVIAGGAALAAGASLALAGCGGSATGTGAGASDVAGFLPAGAPVYLEAPTDLAGGQWTEAMMLAKRFPGYGKVVTSLTRDLSKDGLDFNAQIKPLLGSGAAIGLYDVKHAVTGGAKHPSGDRRAGVDPANADAVAAIDLADGKGPDLVKLIQSGKHPAKKLGDFQGVTLYGDGDAVFGVVDGTAVVGTTEALVKRAIEAHNAGTGQTMAGSKRLKDALAELPDQVLAQGFVDVGAFVKMAGGTGSGAVAKQLADAGVGSDAGIGVSVSAEQDGLRVKAVGIGMRSDATRLEQFTPTLVKHVPGDAIAYVGFRNAFGIVDQAMQQLASGKDAQSGKDLAQAELALPLLGVTKDDLKALTSGEHAVVVTKGATEPGVVAALEVADPKRATATLDALRTNGPTLLKKAGKPIPPFTAVPLGNGVTGWRSQVTPTTGVVFGVDGNLALIGTQVAAVRQVQSPTSTLADDPGFQAATREMPSKVGGIAWINGEELRRALDNLGALKGAPKDTVANLRPVQSIAAWTSTTGDKPTFEAFITIK